MGQGAVDGAPISLSEYAKYRGISCAAVSKAVARGRLARSVVTVHGQPKIRSIVAADKEWVANTNPMKAPGGAMGVGRTRVRAPEPPRIGGLHTPRRFELCVSRGGRNVVMAAVPSGEPPMEMPGVGEVDDYVSSAARVNAVPWDADDSTIFEMSQETAEQLAVMLLDAVAAAKQREEAK